MPISNLKIWPFFHKSNEASPIRLILVEFCICIENFAYFSPCEIIFLAKTSRSSTSLQLFLIRTQFMHQTIISFSDFSEYSNITATVFVIVMIILLLVLLICCVKTVLVCRRQKRVNDQRRRMMQRDNHNHEQSQVRLFKINHFIRDFLNKH